MQPTTGGWCAWRSCWCATRRPPRRWSRTRSWPCTASGAPSRSRTAGAYLRQTVVNRARSVLRHRGVQSRYIAAHGGDPAPVEPGADQQALADERRKRVLDAMRELPGRQREVLALRYYLDLSEADIAETLGISRGAVKSHASRGVAALREQLRGRLGDRLEDL